MADDIHNLTRHPNPAIPPFFSNGPHNWASLGGARGGFCRNFNRGLDVSVNHASTDTCATPVMANTLDPHVPLSIPNLPSTISKIQNVTTTLKNQNEIKEQPLPTPISIQHLEAALSGHPDQHFVSQLCNNFKFGVHIGFQGQRAPRFSRNLPTALANPDVVSSHLAKEVSLGRTAGPFDTPPFKNFQVSPIGLVPKKNSNKFRTIFYLSYPKSGSTSINCSIP